MKGRLLAGTIAMLASTAALAGGESMRAPGSERIPALYEHVAERHGVPTELLYAVALQESRQRNPETGYVEPWPWTINHARRAYFLDSEEEAIAKVAELEAGGARSIDVGFGQVNLRWNGHLLMEPTTRFDPETNLDAAATVLVRELNVCGFTSWRCAVERYHTQSQEPEHRARAVAYAVSVFDLMEEQAKPLQQTLIASAEGDLR